MTGGIVDCRLVRLAAGLLEEVTLGLLGIEAVLVEEFYVVVIGDFFEVSQFVPEFGAPVGVVVEHFGVKVFAEERAAGGDYAAGIVGFDGEDVAGLFVSVDGFHSDVYRIEKAV